MGEGSGVRHFVTIFGSHQQWEKALMYRLILSTLQAVQLTAGVLLIAAAALAAQNTTADQTQKRFKTAEEAVQSVIKAAKANNRAELLAIFGADAEDLFSSGDKI